MSGHSKWATIKREEGRRPIRPAAKCSRSASRRSRSPRATAAVTRGANPRLRTAIAAAKARQHAGRQHRPRRSSAARARSRACTYEETQYEGYAPGGVALLVEVATDNRNRTAGDVRHTLHALRRRPRPRRAASRYLFKPRGLIVIERTATPEDALIEIALDAGADDVAAAGDVYEVLTAAGALRGRARRGRGQRDRVPRAPS